MWLGTKEVSTIECSYEDLKEENIELRRERMILQSLISKNKIVNTGNNLVDMNSEIDIENKFDSLYSEFQRSQQIIKDYDLRLKDAVRSLQESRIEALQVLPLRLKIHELNAKIETLKRSLQSEVNLRIEANEEVKRKQESLVENQERLNQETSKVAILETEVNTLNQMISDLQKDFDESHQLCNYQINQIGILTAFVDKLNDANIRLDTENNFLEKKCQSLSHELSRIHDAFGEELTESDIIYRILDLKRENEELKSCQEVMSINSMVPISRPKSTFSSIRFFPLSSCIWDDSSLDSYHTFSNRSISNQIFMNCRHASGDDDDSFRL